MKIERTHNFSKALVIAKEKQTCEFCIDEDPEDEFICLSCTKVKGRNPIELGEYYETVIAALEVAKMYADAEEVKNDEE